MSLNASPPVPRLVTLTTAVPPFDLPQEEVAARAATLFAPTEGGFHRLAPIYGNALIERRHACVPLDWFLEDHGFRERNALFLHHATDLAAGHCLSLKSVCEAIHVGPGILP
jgi:alkylresorcinol/alkylpyrone synthase